MPSNRDPRLLLTGVSCIAIAVAFPAASVMADGHGYSTRPAVSSPNGKIAVLGGGLEDEGLGLLTGAYSMPLSHSIGLQIDGMIGTLGGDALFGAGAHLFTRDPDRYLLGLYGDIVHNDFSDYTIGHIGVEGELYHGNWTFSANAGFQIDDDPVIDDGGYVIADAAYYVTPDFKVYGGYRFISDTSMGAAGFEHQLQTAHQQGISVFAEGRAGDDDHWALFGGLRVYFGDEKSLIARHREDDPGIPMINSIIVRDMPTGKKSGEEPDCEIECD